MTDHDVMHGIQPASDCLLDWEAMYGKARARQCSRCQMKVIDLEGLSENDTKALLCTQGFKAGTPLFRRGDGKFVIGDCFKQRCPNAGVALAFVATPVLSFLLFCHPSLAIFANPTTYFVLGPSMVWVLVGAALTSKTRSATVAGVYFAIFVLQALLAPLLFY